MTRGFPLGVAPPDRPSLAELEAKVKWLEEWRRGALASLGQWHRLEELVPESFTVWGAKWPVVVADYVSHLTQEVRRLEALVESLQRQLVDQAVR